MKWLSCFSYTQSIIGKLDQTVLWEWHKYSTILAQRINSSASTPFSVREEEIDHVAALRMD